VHFGLSGRPELFAAVGLFALMLLLKVVNATRYQFNTDESQHLHVIWGWARGFVQYRDLCDNHMPLFQIAMAPIFGLFGDRADILYWMRFLMLPLYLLAVWCTYRIGAICFSCRVGVWAAIMAGSYPGYHFCSLEFRTDNLWAPLWLLAMLVLLEGRVTTRRATIAGLILGLCFGVSMKSILLLMSIVAGAALTFAFAKAPTLKLSRGSLLRALAAFLASTAIVPLIIIVAFVANGLWRPFQYWVFENNIVHGLTNHPAWWSLSFPLLMPVVIYGGRRLMRGAPTDDAALRRGFLFYVCGFYMPALWTFWPLVTRQDYLPWHPLAFIFYAAALVALTEWIAAGAFSRIRLLLPPLAVCAELAAILIVHPFWINGAKDEADLLQTTLAVSDPGDFVVDEKGETVFRQRAYGPIWEPCVMERIRRGLLVDDAPERCVQTRCCIAVLGKDISARTSEFIAQNYLPITSQVRIAGAWLQRSPADSHRFEFTTVIPASYEVLSLNGLAAGVLDGELSNGPRFLSPGHHTFQSDGQENELAALWSKAADRHFTPFPRRNVPPRM
jgi:hypothetical protein